MKGFIVKLSTIIITVAVANTILNAVENLEDGKTIFGKVKQPRRTKIDNHGNIILGTRDYKIRKCEAD